MARPLPLSRRRTSLRLLEFGIRWPPETFIRARLEHLTAAGVSVIVATAYASDGAPPPSGLRVVPIAAFGRTRWRLSAAGAGSLAMLIISRPRRALAVIKSARRPTAAGETIGRGERRARLLAFARLARLRPDIIHFEWASAAVDYISLVEALGCSAVLSCRSEPDFYRVVPSRRHVGRGLEPVFAQVAAVHCVAEPIRRQALATGLEPGKATVIHRGVDPDLFRPPRKPRRSGARFVVVSVGHLRWLKGHEYAVLAIAELVGAGIPAALEIIGADPAPEVGEASQRQRILQTAAHLGVADRIHLHGQLEPADVCARLQGADSLLHASLSEGLPGAVLEAMACGLPVVATDVGGTAEALTDGVEGFLVPPRDFRAAAHALAELWHHPDLRFRMGEAGRARVTAQFKPDRQTEAWIALYGGVANHG